MRVLAVWAVPVAVLAILSIWPALPGNTFSIGSAASGKKSPPFRDGDIIFQSSRSGQSLAVQLATASPYSHCGILFSENGEWFVWEAVQPVKKTPVKQFIARGDDAHYVVKRLRDAGEKLDPKVIAEMKEVAASYLGRDYDLTFEWSDDRIYCSEYVWKIYSRAAGAEVGELQRLSEFDLSHPEVAKVVKERYGSDIPWEETVVSPGAIFDCSELVEVHRQ